MRNSFLKTRSIFRRENPSGVSSSFKTTKPKQDGWVAMDWGDLKFFLAVARNGTLSAAAAGMRTTPSRVSRHVEALELALGYSLFRRSLDGYRLTDEGRLLVRRAEAPKSGRRGSESGYGGGLTYLASVECRRALHVSRGPRLGKAARITPGPDD